MRYGAVGIDVQPTRPTSSESPCSGCGGPAVAWKSTPPTSACGCEAVASALGRKSADRGDWRRTRTKKGQKVKGECVRKMRASVGRTELARELG